MRVDKYLIRTLAWIVVEAFGRRTTGGDLATTVDLGFLLPTLTSLPVNGVNIVVDDSYGSLLCRLLSACAIKPRIAEIQPGSLVGLQRIPFHRQIYAYIVEVAILAVREGREFKSSGSRGARKQPEKRSVLVASKTSE